MQNIKYRFIQNVGDYFPSGYFSDDFLAKVQKCAGVSNDEMKSLCTPFVHLRQEYNDYKNFIINDSPRVEDAIKKTHDFHTSLLKILGYDTGHAYSEHCIVNEESDPVEMIPVRHVLRQGSQVKMLIMEMQNLITIDDKEPAGLFEQQYESEPTTNRVPSSSLEWPRCEGGRQSQPITMDSFSATHLTPMQRQLMEMFVASGSHRLSKHEICDALWPKKDDASETLYALISRLKRELDKTSSFDIISDRGRAYILKRRKSES